jgi:hypothetical protein
MRSLTSYCCKDGAFGFSSSMVRYVAARQSGIRMQRMLAQQCIAMTRLTTPQLQVNITRFQIGKYLSVLQRSARGCIAPW